MAEPDRLCALHDQMTRRWGRCVCAHPVNTAAAAVNPPSDVETPSLRQNGKPAVSAPRYSKYVKTTAQRYAWEYAQATRIRREAISRGAPAEPSDQILRMAVYLRDAGRCQLCGRPLNPDRIGVPQEKDPGRMTLEHVVPVSRGGTHTYDNVHAACQQCNFEKGDDLPDE